MFRSEFVAAFAALLAFVVAVPAVTGTPPAASAAQAIPGSYIVVLKDGSDADAEAGKATRDHGATVDHVYKHALNGYAFRGSAKAAAALAKNPNVQFVAEDQAVEAIGKPSDGPSVAAQTVPTGVTRIGAPRPNTGVGIGVAVIDTGIDLSHPDLAGGIGAGKTCIRGGKSPNDDNGHGTHVAGTIGARANSIGVVGVAAGVTLYPVKVLNSAGSGTWSQVICGIDWVAKNAATLNIKVANMSLGGSGSVTGTCATTTDAMRKAICNATNNKGVTFVVAAGNNGADLDTFTPAAYPEVLTVTAISDSNGVVGGVVAQNFCRPGEGEDVPATFSNYATTNVAAAHTIAGPGVCIYSTAKGGSYANMSGTSMASPHVAGVVALCIKAAPVNGIGCAGSPADVIAKVRADAAESYASGTKLYGNMVNAAAY